ncbi:Zinc finger MIZ domain-containing protein 1 [Schistosoma japonicum]|nr:Zinc finger MIZ domain-containing protein 1 [Schistosoma japonicum]
MNTDRLVCPITNGMVWGPTQIQLNDVMHQYLPDGIYIRRFEFDLTANHLSTIVGRSDLDIVVCSHLLSEPLQVCHWPPDAVQIRFNDYLLRLDRSSVNGGQPAHKVACVKQLCRPGRNQLEIAILGLGEDPNQPSTMAKRRATAQTLEAHRFAAFMAHMPALNVLLDGLQRRRPAGVNTLCDILEGRVGTRNSNEDGSSIQNVLSGSSQTPVVAELNLICPVFRTRMRIPGRIAGCQHVEAFDMEAFLRREVLWPRLNCPICGHKSPAGLDGLCIDTTILYALQLVPQSTESILVRSDGYWRLVPPLCLDLPVDVDQWQPLIGPLTELVSQAFNHISTKVPLRGQASGNIGVRQIPTHCHPNVSQPAITDWNRSPLQRISPQQQQLLPKVTSSTRKSQQLHPTSQTTKVVTCQSDIIGSPQWMVLDSCSPNNQTNLENTCSSVSCGPLELVDSAYSSAASRPSSQPGYFLKSSSWTPTFLRLNTHRCICMFIHGTRSCLALVLSLDISPYNSSDIIFIIRFCAFIEIIYSIPPSDFLVSWIGAQSSPDKVSTSTSLPSSPSISTRSVSCFSMAAIPGVNMCAVDSLSSASNLSLMTTTSTCTTTTAVTMNKSFLATCVSSDMSKGGGATAEKRIDIAGGDNSYHIPMTVIATTTTTTLTGFSTDGVSSKCGISVSVNNEHISPLNVNLESSGNLASSNKKCPTSSLNMGLDFLLTEDQAITSTAISSSERSPQMSSAVVSAAVRSLLTSGCDTVSSISPVASTSTTNSEELSFITTKCTYNSFSEQSTSPSKCESIPFKCEQSPNGCADALIPDSYPNNEEKCSVNNQSGDFVSKVKNDMKTTLDESDEDTSLVLSEMSMPIKRMKLESPQISPQISLHTHVVEQQIVNPPDKYDNDIVSTKQSTINSVTTGLNDELLEVKKVISGHSDDNDSCYPGYVGLVNNDFDDGKLSIELIHSVSSKIDHLDLFLDESYIRFVEHFPCV